jgi:hypothetical protein
MRILCFFLLGLTSCGCNRSLQDFAPNHSRLSPSCELEIQRDVAVKYKPKIQLDFDWKL